VGEFVNRIRTGPRFALLLVMVFTPVLFCAKAGAEIRACEKEPRKIIPGFDESEARVRARIDAGETVDLAGLEACSAKIQNCATDLSPISIETVELFKNFSLSKTSKKMVTGKFKKETREALDNGDDLISCDRDGLAARTAAAVAIASAAVQAEEDLEALKADRIADEKERLRLALIASPLMCRDLEEFNELAGISAQVDDFQDRIVEEAAVLEVVYGMCKGLKTASSKWKRSRGKKGGLDLERKLLASLRAHSDLPKFALYEKWPGCPCDKDKSSRKIKGVCFKGLTPYDPIDERVPQLLERYAEKLQAWAVANGMTLSSVQMGGCSFARLARAGGHEDGTFDHSDISSHAESSACDLYSATFEETVKSGKDRVKTKTKTVKFFDLRSRKRKKIQSHPFADAFQKYLNWMDKEKPLIERMAFKRHDVELKREIVKRVNSSKDRTKGKHHDIEEKKSKSRIPEAIYDYRKLADELEKNGCPLKDENSCDQLRLGFLLINAGRDVGFLTIAPGVGSHDGHVHLGASPDEQDSLRLTSGLMPTECHDKLIDYYVIRAAGLELPYPQCAERFKMSR